MLNLEGIQEFPHSVFVNHRKSKLYFVVFLDVKNEILLAYHLGVGPLSILLSYLDPNYLQLIFDDVFRHLFSMKLVDFFPRISDFKLSFFNFIKG